jgi:hypothetical protein
MRRSALEMEVSALEMRPSAPEMRLSALEMEAAALEMRLSALEMKSSALEIEVSGVEMRLSALEMEGSALEMEVSGVEMRRFRALACECHARVWGGVICERVNVCGLAQICEVRGGGEKHLESIHQTQTSASGSGPMPDHHRACRAACGGIDHG